MKIMLVMWKVNQKLQMHCFKIYSVEHMSDVLREWIFNAGVPLEPTLQPTLRLKGRLQKSGVGYKNPQKGQENTGLVASSRLDGSLTDRTW